MTISTLRSKEAKAFVPARDFDLSKRFYEALGFDCIWSTGDVAYFKHGNSAFLLQNFHVAECTDNFKMHLLVEDVDKWWDHIAKVADGFGIQVEQPEDRPWGMRDFPLLDPSGVLWRIGQPVAR